VEYALYRPLTPETGVQAPVGLPKEIQWVAKKFASHFLFQRSIPNTIPNKKIKFYLDRHPFPSSQFSCLKSAANPPPKIYPSSLFKPIDHIPLNIKNGIPLLLCLFS
jgi:hypothetical protein